MVPEEHPWPSVTVFPDKTERLMQDLDKARDAPRTHSSACLKAQQR